jgi:rsbT co-antagonist protein RsbR
MISSQVLYRSGLHLELLFKTLWIRSIAVTSQNQNGLSNVLVKNEQELLENWLQEQMASPGRRSDLTTEPQMRQQSAEFLRLLRQALQTGDSSHDIHALPWSNVRAFLENLSRSRALQGFSPTETATFIFSFKQGLFERLRREFSDDGPALAQIVLESSLLLDKLGLYTTEVYQKSRDEIIRRQQQELVELSTPVVKLWKGVLAVPVIGTLDSARTQVVMEALLQKIVDTGSSVAIIDITGVPIVDTLTAQHLLKTVAAARLMGAECIISGIRPQIAQTIVHLGVDLSDVITKADLSSALAVALQRNDFVIVPSSKH